jgi:hypothetical protein
MGVNAARTCLKKTNSPSNHTRSAYSEVMELHQKAVESPQLDLQHSLNFVETANEKMDRVFARIHRMHGGNLSEFYESLRISEGSMDQGPNYFFFASPVITHRKSG